MKKNVFTLAFILGVMAGNAQISITHVNLIDVVNQKLLPDQTVIVRNNLITAIAPSGKLKPFPGSLVIEGAGRYLMPGLTDAHIHFFQSGGLYARPDAIDLRKYHPYGMEINWVHQHMDEILRRYLRLGITSVVDVGATLSFLQQRDSFVNKTYAPSIFMTGPLLTTWEPPVYQNLGSDEPFFLVKTPEEARAMVQKQLPFKPDFIKIWYIVALGENTTAAARQYQPLIQAAIEEAHKNKLRVAVHATERIAAQLAVESGCDYLVHGVDDEIVDPAFLQLLKNKQVVVCPTLIVADNYGKVFSGQLSFPVPAFSQTNPEAMGSLFDLQHIPDQQLAKLYKLAGVRELALNKTPDSIRAVNLKKMLDAGIPIASGTDAGNIGTLHGSSYFEELDAMQKAGMNNWQILQAATLNAAKAIGKQHELGSINPGKIADMILLHANPLEKIANLQSLDLVIHNGAIIKPDTLLMPEAVVIVEQQINGYNAHNLDAFLEPYDEQVELYDFPDKLICKGKSEMKKQYSFLNSSPTLHCMIRNRQVRGNTIIDDEKVTGLGDQPLAVTVIYIIADGKIRNVYFVH